MADDRGFSAGAVGLAFLSGALIGVAVALLLTPQSGRETQEQLRGYARRAEDRVRSLAGKAGEVFDEAVEKGREYVQTQKSVLAEAFEAGREAMKRERERLAAEKKDS
ncbi:MAG: YtxH domain-containing protein [Nitrospirae bacterium]|nr:YtxH domain-containing protein [Nitrospirota bacterium]